MAKIPSFEELLASTKRSAIHLEMRDAYMLSDPSYVAWKAGDRALPEDNDPEQRPWLKWVRSATDRGAVLRRARVFSVPESDYIKFEYHVSDANVEAGEQIGWLSRRLATDIPFPGNDFWVFDNEKALILHFDGDGELDVADCEMTTDRKVIDLCVNAFEAVWDRATPHAEYRPS
ncbi:DUF6879 family protein [Streptomyces tsukubensis]|uniref:DUF6879 family protein n=1 Tax=Streptomyces TaxID=1883 RepID=UPI00368F0C3A